MNRNIRLVYAISFAKNFVLFFSVFVLFLEAHGLSMEEIFWLRTIHVLTIVLLEVPTGYLSDRIGHKNTLVLAAGTAVVGSLVYCIAYGFWLFLIGELIMALQMSLFSGTFDAFTHESIGAIDKETEFRNVKSRATILDATANAMAAFLGGFLGAISLRWTVYAIVPVFLLTFLLTLFLREPPGQKMNPSLGDGSFLHVLRFTRNYRPLRHFLPFYSLHAGMLTIAFWLAQKYQGLIEMPTWMYGILECSYEAGIALVGMVALWLGSRFGDRRILLLTSVLVAGSYIVCGLILHVGCIGLLILARSLRGIFDPMTCDIFNKMPIGGRRATVLSFASLCARLGEVLFCIVAAIAIRFGDSDIASFIVVGSVRMIALIVSFVYAIPSFEKVGE